MKSKNMLDIQYTERAAGLEASYLRKYDPAKVRFDGKISTCNAVHNISLELAKIISLSYLYKTPLLIGIATEMKLHC